MRPPKRVQVGPFAYEVTVQRSDDSGSCEKEQGRITVSPNQSPDAMRDAMLHELLHALFYVAGFDKDLSDDHEEAVCRRLSPLLLDTFRRNPSLCRYLLA